MRFADVVGHERVSARLGRAVAEDRVPGALLLLGPPGIGKRRVADAFAARLLCLAPEGGDACGACAHCTRLAAGTHPDLRLVTRDEERRDIRIEQVRELARWLALQPLMATRKIAVVDGAHCLNEHGQNALLKTLEEPPAASVLVLIAPSAGLLLPTIRSRCQVFRLDPLPREGVVRVLTAAGVSPERARDLASLAEGSPGQALAYEGEDAAGARAAVLESAPRLGALSAHEISKLAQDLAKGPPEPAFATLLAWYRDVLETSLLGEQAELRNVDATSAVRAAAGRPPVTALRQLEAVCDTIAAVESNANRMLSLETMLLWLREIDRGTGTAVPGGPPWTSTA